MSTIHQTDIRGSEPHSHMFVWSAPSSNVGWSSKLVPHTSNGDPPVVALLSTFCPFVLAVGQRVKGRPEKTTHLSGDGSDGDVDVLAASEEIVEPFGQSMLGLECDGDDLG